MSKLTWRLIVREPGAPARRVDVNGPELFVGRHPNCDLCLQDPSVSGRHARLWIEDGALRVEDLGSTNTTRLEGGAELAIGMSADLVSGDVVMLGKTRVEVLGTPDDRVSASELLQGPGSTIRLSEAMAAPADQLAFDEEDLPASATAQIRNADFSSDAELEATLALVQRRRARLTICGRGIHEVVDVATVPFVVGRKAGEGVGLVLRHEQVSTRHLRIEFSNGHFQVRDLGSSNGTRVDGVAVVGDFPRPLGQDSILDVGPLHCLFTCLYDDQGRIADPEDFDQAAKALLEEGLIDEPGLERARELLSETDGNRHLGEILLSHQGTRLTINRWLNALALVRGRSGGAIPASRWRWRSILDAAYGWFNRGRAQG